MRKTTSPRTLGAFSEDSVTIVNVGVSEKLPYTKNYVVIALSEQCSDYMTFEYESPDEDNIHVVPLNPMLLERTLQRAQRPNSTRSWTRNHSITRYP